MQLPFEGFIVPPAPYVVGLVVGAVVTIGALYYRRPPVTQKTVLAFVPWMVSGAALHMFFQLGETFQVRLFPPTVEPLFSAPAVYLTTFVVMGAFWLVSDIFGETTRSAADASEKTSVIFGTIGLGVMVTLVSLLVWQGLDPAVGPPKLVIPAAGLAATSVLTVLVVFLISVWRTYIIASTRYAGVIVIFAHLFDGVTTAIGRDILGTAERSVLPREIMEFAADLPTAAYIGSGWLFVVVKAALAVFIVVAFADVVSRQQVKGNLLFTFIAAVGLGPAMNNFFLFMLGLGA